MERLAATGDGRVEVSGRWYGVRGRRFMRPTLTLTLSDGDADADAERSWLADLEHKPWAAQDGELWMAAFPADVALDSASAIELSVAPDIEIALGSGSASSQAGAPGTTAVAAVGARAPVAKQPSSSRRPSARAQDVERLTTRLTASEAALERERERRAATELTLEEQRAELRKLNAELGRARAELDLAQTRQQEAEAMSTELDHTRREMRSVEWRHDELSQEHDREVAAYAKLEEELRERTGALESARDALEQERARGAEALEQERVRSARTAASTTSAPGSGADDDPPLTEGNADSGADDPRDTEAYAPLFGRVDPISPRPVVAHRANRPVNPALSPRFSWVGRILALLVIAGVLLALWLVLHSTVLHH